MICLRPYTESTTEPRRYSGLLTPTPVLFLRPGAGPLWVTLASCLVMSTSKHATLTHPSDSLPLCLTHRCPVFSRPPRQPLPHPVPCFDSWVSSSLVTTRITNAHQAHVASRPSEQPGPQSHFGGQTSPTPMREIDGGQSTNKKPLGHMSLSRTPL